MSGKNQLQGETLSFRGLLVIPLAIRWTAGVPAIVSNPLNESIALTDNGTGDVTLTLAVASLAPVMVLGAIATVAETLELGAVPTAAAVQILAKTDAGVAIDPGDLHLTLLKTVAN